ncbi:MAG: acyl-ACP--UDP-N-acetylglucosamine O-acyltransferase [Mariprofundaceae bacterium]|nr:acyl-ACP--UDP-N-acetylglucosamine O-acyltransferase [Mariprofundaceae bacterium]
MKQHPTAIIAEGAQIHDDVIIGPYCVVGEHVSIDAGTELKSHVSLDGYTTIGKKNRFFPFSSIAREPQDLKFHGEKSQVIIGDNNTIRENVTINPGTEGGGMITRLGNNNLLMAYVHIAHDCILKDDIVMANCATLAGHIEVGNGAIIGGLSAIHQFLRIGDHAMIGGMSGVVKDVPPFCLTAGGYRPSLAGLNIVALRRHKVAKESIHNLKKVYRILLQDTGKLSERLNEARDVSTEDIYCQQLIEFTETAKRGLTLHRRASQ